MNATINRWSVENIVVDNDPVNILSLRSFVNNNTTWCPQTRDLIMIAHWKFPQRSVNKTEIKLVSFSSAKVFSST